MRAKILEIASFMVVSLFITTTIQSAFAAEEPQVVEEKESVWPGALLFPLKIPPLVVRGIGYPFVAAADWSEKVHLNARMIDFFSNDARTAFVYPAFRTGASDYLYLGAGAVHTDLFGRNLNGSIFALVSPGLDVDASASISGFRMGEGGPKYGFGYSGQRKRNARYYGVGNDTVDDRTTYESFDQNFDVPVSGKIGKMARWKVVTSFVSLIQEEFDDDPLSAKFSAAELNGLEETILGGEAGVGLSLDTSDSQGTPGEGTKGKVSVSYLRGNHDAGFIRTKLSATQYFTAFLPGRVFAFGGRLEMVHTPGGTEVPFSYLPSMGGSSKLRGFDTDRFHDRAAVILIGEYRYPVWNLIDGSLFVEGGRVGSGIDDLGITGFHLSYGGGLRFRTRSFFFFQFQVAGSSEGPQYVFTLNQSL